MAKITKDTLISDCLELNPNAPDKLAQVLMKSGMHCLHCALAHGETIEQAVAVHGEDLETLLKRLNEGLE